MRSKKPKTEVVIAWAGFLLGCGLLLVSTGCAGTQTSSPSRMPGIVTDTPPTIPSEISAVRQDGSYIAMAGTIDDATLFLVNIDTGAHGKLGIPGETRLNLYGWSADACTLFVGTETDRVVQVDLEGEIKKELLRLDELQVDDHIMTRTLKISPDAGWLAFLAGTGNQEYATYEFQDLVVVSVQDHKTYPLTDSGSVNDMSWSPDGRSIAYNDVDAKGVQQIFISNADGSERHQLSYLDKKGLRIRSLQWSPTGEKLAFILEEGDTKRLGLIETSPEHKMISIQAAGEVQGYWWGPGDVLVANVSASGDETIAWYSAVSGEKLGQLDPSSLPDRHLVLPGRWAFQTGRASSPITGFMSTIDPLRSSSRSSINSRTCAIGSQRPNRFTGKIAAWKKSSVDGVSWQACGQFLGRG